jgi:hypothetical protein
VSQGSAKVLIAVALNLIIYSIFATMNFPGTGGSSAAPLGVMGGGMAGGMDAQQMQEAQMVKTVCCVLSTPLCIY